MQANIHTLNYKKYCLYLISSTLGLREQQHNSRSCFKRANNSFFKIEFKLMKTTLLLKSPTIKRQHNNWTQRVKCGSKYNWARCGLWRSRPKPLSFIKSKIWEMHSSAERKDTMIFLTSSPNIRDLTKRFKWWAEKLNANSNWFW